MEDLLKKIQNVHNLSEAESKAILQTIADYLKEKFPMVKGAIENMFKEPDSEMQQGTTPSDFQSVTKSSPPSPDDILE